MLYRWALTPDAGDVPGLEEVARVTGPGGLEAPATAFLGMHAAVTLLALQDLDGLRRLAARCASHPHAAQREVVAPLADALWVLGSGRASEAADLLAALAPQCWRFGGSDAQREIVEETRIAALLRAERYDDARVLLDSRLDRRPSPRDHRWRQVAVAVP